MDFLYYTPGMKLGSFIKILALASPLLVIGTGCGSIYAAPSVSPLMFLLPGFVETKPALLQTAAPGQTATNWNMAQAKLNLCDSLSR